MTKTEIINITRNFMVYWKKYGVTMNVDLDNLNHVMVVKITVPETSEVELKGKEASGDYLAKEFANEYRKIFGYGLISIKVLQKSRGEHWTYQKSIDEIIKVDLAAGITSVMTDEELEELIERSDNGNYYDD